MWQTWDFFHPPSLNHQALEPFLDHQTLLVSWDPSFITFYLWNHLLILLLFLIPCLDLSWECFFPLRKKNKKTWERRKDSCSYMEWWKMCWKTILYRICCYNFHGVEFQVWWNYFENSLGFWGIFSLLLKNKFEIWNVSAYCC